MAVCLATGYEELVVLNLLWLYAGWIAQKRYRKLGKLLAQPVHILFIIWFLLYPLSLLFTDNLAQGRREIEQHLSYLFMPVVIGTGPRLSQQEVSKLLQWFFRALLVLLLLCLVLSAWDYYQTGSLRFFHDERMDHRFTSFGLVHHFFRWHPVFIAVLLVLGIALHLIVLLEGKSTKKQKKEYIFYILLSLGFIVLLQSLMSLMVLMITVPLVMLWYFHHNSGWMQRNLRWLTVAGSVLLVATVFGIYQNDFYNEKIRKVVHGNLEPTDKKQLRNSLTLRLAKWESSLTLIERNWLTGVAPGDLKDDLQKVYLEKDYQYLYKERVDPHNEYLLIFSSFGIIGLLIFTALLLAPVAYIIRQQDLVYACFLLVFALGMCSDSMLERQHTLMIFTFFHSVLAQQTYFKQYDRGKLSKTAPLLRRATI